MYGITLFTSRMYVFYDIYTELCAMVKGEQYLLQRCNDPEFFSNIRQHTDLCTTVFANARQNIFLKALNKTLQGLFPFECLFLRFFVFLVTSFFVFLVTSFFVFLVTSFFVFLVIYRYSHTPFTHATVGTYLCGTQPCTELVQVVVSRLSWHVLICALVFIIFLPNLIISFTKIFQHRSISLLEHRLIQNANNLGNQYPINMPHYNKYESIADIPYDENMYVNDLRKRNMQQLQDVDRDSVRLV
jgi:glucan phosphoethanolaminetransferase (alkaline phosphatase superfamily)